MMMPDNNNNNNPICKAPECQKFINGRSCARAVKIWLKIALNAVRLPNLNRLTGNRGRRGR